MVNLRETLCRKGECEFTPFADFTGNPDLSTVHLDNISGNIESQTCSPGFKYVVFFETIETIKDQRLLLRWDADSGITYTCLNVSLVMFHVYHDLASRRGIEYSIVNQVDDSLLNLVPVCHDKAISIGFHETHFNFFLSSKRTKTPGDFFDQL